MPALVTVVPPFTMGNLDSCTSLSWLWLGVLLLPLVPLAVQRLVLRQRRRTPGCPPMARHPAPYGCRRTLFRWPTRFPVVLLAPVCDAGPGAGRATGTATEPQPLPGHATGPCAGRGTGPALEPRRLPAMVLDISGGGLRVRLQEALPPGTRLRIDPEYVGPFPLAGLHCRVLSSHHEGEQVYLQLCFVHLPAETEARIVRRIYERQVGIGLTNPMHPDRLQLRRRQGLYRRGPTQGQ